MPKRLLLLPMLLLLFVSLRAQTVLNNEAAIHLRHFEVLADRGYSFGQVQQLPFAPADSLSTSGHNAYWARFTVDNPYPNHEPYRLSLSLPLNYTLYFFDATTHTWQSITAGPSVARRQRDPGSVPLVLAPNDRHTFFIKIDLRNLQRYGYTIRPEIVLEKEITFQERETRAWVPWLFSIAVLCSFCGYHFYIYLQLRDRVYRCYLVLQLGAMVYITAYKHFFSWLLPSTIYNLRLTPEGAVYYYGINAFMLHVGGIIVLSSLLQLTRLFLRTQALLPDYDRLLRGFLRGYIVITLVPAFITLSGLYYLDNYLLTFENLLILVMLCMIFFISAVAYRRKVRAAREFLLANLLPILFAAAVAIYYVITPAPNYTRNESFLPEIAILSQISTFAVALVARLRLVDADLKNKEAEVQQLAADIALTEYKHTLIEQENQFIVTAMQHEKDRNEVLQQKLEANQRELVGNSLYIHQKNKLLADLKAQIENIDHLYPHVKKTLQTSLNDSHHLDAEWDKFKLHFEQVHPGFFEKLRAAHPSLTSHELRLHAYFHMNLSTKEIAALLNIAPASVRQAKTRLLKKMGQGNSAE